MQVERRRFTEVGGGSHLYRFLTRPVQITGVDVILLGRQGPKLLPGLAFQVFTEKQEQSPIILLISLQGISQIDHHLNPHGLLRLARKGGYGKEEYEEGAHWFVFGRRYGFMGMMSAK